MIHVNGSSMNEKLRVAILLVRNRVSEASGLTLSDLTNHGDGGVYLNKNTSFQRRNIHLNLWLEWTG